MRAILFPGQGAQAVGMGRDLAEHFPECRALFDRAGKVLGFDLAKACFEGPIEQLTRSSVAQPAIFVVSAAAWLALQLRRPGLKVAAAAGLSSGEWAALYAAGVLSFEDSLRVLEARGRFMQDACEEHAGGMLSLIGLDLAGAEKLARDSGVEVANLNSPEQTVLSGSREGIDRAEAGAKMAGAKKAVRLNVAGAFHSSLMTTAARRLEEFLAAIPFGAPTMPVLSNVTGQPHGDPESIRQLMVRQVTSSVRWVDDVRWMQGQGVTQYAECGPGKVLAGLVRRIDNGATVHNIQDSLGVEGAAQAWVD